MVHDGLSWIIMVLMGFDDFDGFIWFLMVIDG